LKPGKLWYHTIQYFNKFNPNPSFTPKWSDKPLLKSWEKSKPTLGWPRRRIRCVPIACAKRAKLIINGKKDWTDLVHEKVGEIKAQIIERDGQVWMVKECPIHGKFEDLMAVDSKFLEWIEKNFPGRDIPAHNDEGLHKPRFQHGSPWPRFRSHRGPHQPLQHDVRSLLHGREPGWLRPRAELGRNSGNSGQRTEDQAAPPDVRAVLRRRAYHAPAIY
jgi:hypothetical protein